MARIGFDARFAMNWEKAVWEARRRARLLFRRFGVSGIVAAATVLFIAAALFIYLQHSRELQRLAQRVETFRELRKNAAAEDLSDSRSRLRSFESYLLPHEQIPAVVANMIVLARTEGLTLSRGEYRPQPETRGGFMRYRMTLPVKGSADAVHRFMLAALKANKTLALETVQFKRERSGSREVEARIQWVLITRLPRHEARSNGAAVSPGRGGRNEP